MDKTKLIYSDKKDKELLLKIADKLKGKELFPELNKRAREMLKNIKMPL